MKLTIECYPCLLSQVLSTANLCELTDGEKKEVMKFTLSTLATLSSEIYPQEIVVMVNNFMEKAYHDGDVFDPYAGVKNTSREIAQQFYTSIQHRIEQSSAPLEFAVKCAVLGNIIDFGAKNHRDLNITDELKKLDGLEFAIYDYDSFAQCLESATRILYIGDNVGEDVFDKVLITEIKKQYPDKHIMFAVREKPVINDVTLEDARAIGMEQVAEVISSGSIYPGTILSKTTPAFRNIYQKADLVISKGQGNFETLHADVKSPLFFLLRAKCEKIAHVLNVDLGSMILKNNNL